MIIKVCGMREEENIREIGQLDINWIGFIFYPKSPRYVEKNNCPFSTVHCQLKKVGVFVNSTQEEMMDIANRYKLDYLQLHGSESPEFCHTLQKRGLRLIKAFSIENETDLDVTRDYERLTDYFLFDTKCSGYGGSGKRFDWSVLNSYNGRTPFLLSGGISPESADDICSFTHPQLAGIDVNSGFEVVPALKDVSRLAEFVDKIRNQK